MTYTQEKQVAIQAVVQAAHLCERIRHDIVPAAIEKDDRSPVTLADFGAQALICRALAEAFPDDPIVGEEDAALLREAQMADRLEQVTHFVQAIAPDATPASVVEWIDRGNGSVGPRYWTLDPIDGTKGFLRGDQYAVALALVEQGQVQLGVLACPALPVDPAQPEGALGVLFVAVRGQGATAMPLSGGEAQPIRVAAAQDVDGLRFVESVESGHGDHSRQEAIAKAAGISAASIRMDSQAKYGAVARGQAALYLRLPSPKSPQYREKIWDHAAGVIMVEEAGGTVTDMHGQPLDFSIAAKLVQNQGVVVSNGPMHNAVVEALRATAPAT